MRIAALDPAALTDDEVGLPNATLVLDHFHVQELANAAIDDVRRRVQQETTGAANTIRCSRSASRCSSQPTGSTTPGTPGSTRHWLPETPTRRSPATTPRRS